MKRKGCRGDCVKAASIANAVLARTGDEGLAIRTALARANTPRRRHDPRDKHRST